VKKHTAKRRGLGLEFKTFEGKSGDVYTVIRTTKGAFHVLVEIEAKRAARDCGSKKPNTRTAWKELWDSN